MATVLTIAGFDPSSGAGITADLAVFAAHGLFGVSAVTALTIQSTVAVRSVHPVDGRLLRETLEELEGDLPADGIKIGMLGDGDCVAAVAGFVEGVQRTRRPVIVLDPVLRSSSGRALLDGDGLDLLRRRLLPLVDWATPNLEELAVLSGVEDGFLETPTKERIVAAARELQGGYAGLGLVVTGGHLEPPDDLVLGPVQGLGRELWLSGERIRTTATHGTGCAFSSAFLSCLVKGQEAWAAAEAAKHFVAEAMRRAVPRGRGRGPMNLSWPLEREIH